VFNALDAYLWRLTYKWAKFRHPKKPKHWIVERYFGRFNKSRRDRWVFGDHTSGAYLVKFAWTNIVRHQMVTKGASPDDPALTEYWIARRRRAASPPLDNLSLRLLKVQGGTCPVCGELLLVADHPPQSPREWEQWVRVTGKALAKCHMTYQNDGSSDAGTLRLIHARCRPRTSSEAVSEPALLPRPHALGFA
jgi:RNA-directed DNA polymerase